MEHFVLDGKSSKEFNVHISGLSTWGSSSRDVESISIPGRTGDLFIDKKRYRNILLEYEDCFINRDFDKYFPALRGYLMSKSDKYYRLEDSYRPDEFMLARFSGGMYPDVYTRNKSGKFTVAFDCDPRHFLKSGEERIYINSVSKSIYNPTFFKSLPIVEIHSGEPSGSGFSLYINSTRFFFSDLVNGKEYVLDFERHNFYEVDGNDYIPKNELINHVSDWGGLNPGKNSVRISSGASVSYLIPRWYTL